MITRALPQRSALVALVLVSLFLAVAGNAAAAPSYPAIVAGDNPIAYWRLGELGGLVAADSGPYHYDAQLSDTAPGGGALYTDADGAAYLNGNSKIVSSQDWSWLGGAPMGGAPNRAFSLEFWMKPAVLDDRYLWVISEQDKTPVRQGWGVMLTQQPGQPATLSYERWADGKFVGGVGYRNNNATVPNALGVGKWTYVVVTYDGAPNFGGTNTVHLWINGVHVAAVTAQSADMVKITQPFRAGQGDDVGSQPGFVGSIDELAIYGGAIWTANAHYHAAFVAPANTSAPSLSGTAKLGQTLTASGGTWTGAPAPALAYDWQRCDGGGGNCVPIPGASGSTYTVADADAGSTLRAVVTGTNPGGAVTVGTPVTALVHGVAPASTAVPVVSGSGKVGEGLSATSGSWTGVPLPATSLQWQRCSSSGQLCSDIPGATTSTYVPVVSDAGSKLVVRVTATNAEGSATAASAPVTVVSPTPPKPAAPANLVAPAIAGDAVEGSALTAAPGTWDGSPNAYGYQWRRCAADGSCTTLPGVDGTTYTPGFADVGSGLAVVVTATNDGGSTAAASATTAPVAAAVHAPAVTVEPRVSGRAVDGETLTASTGAWSGTAPFAYGYRWLRCGGAGCTTVPGATEGTFTLGAVDVGSTLKVEVTASNAAGSATSTSTATAPVAAAVPVNVTAPAVSGSADERQTLSVDDGSWSGTAPLTYGVQWRRCAADGTCVDIVGATAHSYALARADVGSTVVAVVTASNSGGSSSASSAPAGPVAAAAPTVVSAPVVTGTAVDGRSLSATAGTWDGAGVEYAYRWNRCDGSVCAPVDGVTESTLTLGAGDVGKTFTATVTASNAGGSADSTSAPVGPVTAAAPVAGAAPVVSGTPVERETLSVSDGTWSGTAPFTYGYQWRRCATDGTCADIAGATASSYDLAHADVGSTVVVVVTASNGGGSATSVSAAFGPVTARAPRLVSAPPTVTGTAVDGRTLTATTGTWDGVGLAYAYQWQRCDGSTCTPIDGATGTTYVLTAGDVGSTIGVVVTATTAGGSVDASSEPVGPVTAAPPVSTGAPAITGTPRDGETLTATAGSWSGTAPFTYGYQWRRCASGSCADIAGATERTYTLGHADAGATVAVVVTAANAAAATNATSASVGPVAAIAPANLTVPAVTGNATIGQTLTASSGTWNGTPAFTYAYQWVACGAAGCEPVAGATAQTYTVRPADFASSLRVDVKASNTAGSATASSVTSEVVADTLAPTLAISTIATGGITIAGLNLNLLLTVGVTASDAESGLAADPVCTVDGRAATLKPNGTGAWTVSVLNIGTHVVACTVADKAGNKASATATVRPGGARELEQALLDQVNRLALTANKHDGDRLRKVAAELADALTASNWVDSNHVQPARGEVVFDDNKDAALLLLQMLKDKHTEVPQATLVGMLLTIVQVERVVASAQIAAALQAVRGDKGKSDEAKKELSKGESAAAGGNHDDALDAWKRAWKLAQDAVRKS